MLLGLNNNCFAYMQNTGLFVFRNTCGISSLQRMHENIWIFQPNACLRISVIKTVSIATVPVANPLFFRIITVKYFRLIIIAVKSRVNHTFSRSLTKSSFVFPSKSHIGCSETLSSAARHIPCKQSSIRHPAAKLKIRYIFPPSDNHI